MIDLKKVVAKVSQKSVKFEGEEKTAKILPKTSTKIWNRIITFFAEFIFRCED